MLNKFIRPFENFFMPSPPAQVDTGREYWKYLIDASNLTLVEIIQIRNDARGVFLVRHPEYGECILKTSSVIHEPRIGFANLSIAEIIEETNTGIFPRVLEKTPLYTLEKKIHGHHFNEWLKGDYEISSVKNYFLDLKEWCINSAGYHPMETLNTNEIRYICNDYVQKCMEHLNYRTTTKRFKSLYLINQRKKWIEDQVGYLWSAAENIELPTGMMCGDMNMNNIIVEESSNRLFNIDYEYMSIGHYGFESAYFIASDVKRIPDDVFHELKTTILTNEYLGGKLNGDFFRALSDLLTVIEQIVFYPDTVD